eukprot:scaffold521_cov308-Prasinococcus_capsulatus_cf.AAC.9
MVQDEALSFRLFTLSNKEQLPDRMGGHFCSLLDMSADYPVRFLRYVCAGAGVELRHIPLGPVWPDLSAGSGVGPVRAQVPRHPLQPRRGGQGGAAAGADVAVQLGRDSGHHHRPHVSLDLRGEGGARPCEGSFLTPATMALRCGLDGAALQIVAQASGHVTHGGYDQWEDFLTPKDMQMMEVRCAPP